MNHYYVVRRTKEKDEEFAVIDALSLDEANAIFQLGTIKCLFLGLEGCN
ncbi:hypothetical protein [Pallidibacillus pasinlerensis]|nr:hypothetical protein [Pallidibacillus pasinlerensis]